MRTVFDPQMELDQVAIADIKLDPKSRDDIPQLLRGLQHLHADPELRERVFAILEGLLPGRVGAEGKASPSTGRPGMAQWRILVLGVLRLGLDADYDRIQRLQHSTAKDEKKRQDKHEEIQQAHRGYLDQAEALIARMRGTRNQLAALPATPLRLASLD